MGFAHEYRIFFQASNHTNFPASSPSDFPLKKETPQNILSFSRCFPFFTRLFYYISSPGILKYPKESAVHILFFLPAQNPYALYPVMQTAPRLPGNFPESLRHAHCLHSQYPSMTAYAE